MSELLTRRLLTDAEIPEELRQFKPHLLGFEQKDLRDIPAGAIDGPAMDSLPSAWQLPKITPVRNQQALGSCVGHGVAAMLENLVYRRDGKTAVLATEYAYLVGRAIDGTFPFDRGTYVRSVLKGIAKFGLPPEPLWPYNGFDNNQYFKQVPDVFAQFEGSFGMGFTYVALNSLADLKNSIAQGFGFCGIFYEYEHMFSNEVAQSGHLRMPEPNEGYRGAHCWYNMGFDDNFQNADGSRGAFTAKNSWGEGWGTGGYATMPYGYFTGNEATTSLNDCWSVRPLR